MTIQYCRIIKVSFFFVFDKIMSSSFQGRDLLRSLVKPVIFQRWQRNERKITGACVLRKTQTACEYKIQLISARCVNNTEHVITQQCQKSTHYLLTQLYYARVISYCPLLHIDKVNRRFYFRGAIFIICCQENCKNDFRGAGCEYIFFYYV